jgi:chromosomal replication initiator protein
VKLSELQSRRRTNAIAYPRQVAMYLARKITKHSLEEIGGFFGGRDHSTVMYAVDKVGGLAESDPVCRQVLDEFLAKLEGPGS